MVSSAKRMGLRYYGVSEHFDVDEFSIKLYGGSIDMAAYFMCARALQGGENGEDFTFYAGGEFNFMPEDKVYDTFNRIWDTYHPDYVINSVHVVDGAECSQAAYFEGKSKQYAYSRYLEQVRRSLDAPYPYDIVGHLGYVSRRAPYPDKKIRYADFADLYDDILKTIINKGKILEVNSSARGAESEFLPDTDVLTRYFALGGRRISFGSDAHWEARIGEKYGLVCAALKSLGFTALANPCGGEIPLEVPDEI